MAESLNWGPILLPPRSPEQPLERVARLADAQRHNASQLRDAAKAAHEAGVSWRRLAEAAKVNHVTLFQQVQAGSPVVVVKPNHRRRGEK